VECTGQKTLSPVQGIGLRNISIAITQTEADLRPFIITFLSKVRSLVSRIQRMQRRIVVHFHLERVTNMQNSQISATGSFANMYHRHARRGVLYELWTGTVELLAIANRLSVEVQRRLESP
jgi:hypothetical protein